MSYVSSLVWGRKSIWGLSNTTGLPVKWVQFLGLQWNGIVVLLWIPWKIDLPNVIMWGLLTMRGKAHHLPVPHADTSEGLLSINITEWPTAQEPGPPPPPRLCYTERNRLDFWTYSPSSGVNCFCLERLNGSTFHSTQHNMKWQICTVTADFWPDRQTVSFKSQVFPSPWGWPWVCENQGWPFLP